MAGWLDQLVGRMKGKNVGVLGERGVGKTHLQTFLRDRQLLSSSFKRHAFSGVLMAVILAAASALGAGTAQASSPQYQLDPGDDLGTANSITSPNGRFWLTMDPDGNVRENEPGVINDVATTHTSGHNGAILKMQNDGNLVVIAPGNKPVWSSSTSGHPGTVLQIQDDGGLVLYAPGHQALRVLVPHVDIKRPVPAVEAPGVEPHEVTQAVFDGTKIVGCATAGKIVEELPDGGKPAGIFMEQTCGMAAGGKESAVDGYDVFRLGSTVVLSLVAAPVAAAWDILTDDEASAN